MGLAIVQSLLLPCAAGLCDVKGTNRHAQPWHSALALWEPTGAAIYIIYTAHDSNPTGVQQLQQAGNEPMH